MDGGKDASQRPVWGAKKSWASSPSASSPTATSSRDTASSSSSAFPPLSLPQARRSSSRPGSNTSYPSPSSSLISTSSFNPYPTRRQELAQRAASHGTRKRSHITRSNPSISRIHSILDYENDDDTPMHDLDEDEDDEGEVSSRGTTMSSIVFRDLSSSASTSRSSSPWQQAGMSPGLAIFAMTTFGGEPLKVLANVDEELGAAHMGPRIYKRHNQKHVRNRVRAKIDASHAAHVQDPFSNPSIQDSGADHTIEVLDIELTPEERHRLQSVDLQRVVDECRRRHNLSAIQSRVGFVDAMSSSTTCDPTSTLLAAIRARIAEARTWSTPSSHPVISDDLLPTGLQDPAIDFSVLPPALLARVRQSVLQGLIQLLDSIVQSTRNELISTLTSLISTGSLRPTNVVDPDLKATLQKMFLLLLETFRRPTDRSFSSSVELLSQIFARITDEEPNPMVDLVGELVGMCGQQMSSNPTVFTESQDRALVTTSSFLSLCFAYNSARPAAARLPVHAFYCTVLDLAPFLEHFVHYAASFARTTVPIGLASFNMCQSPFLLSLGAKVRILQLENELRLTRISSRDTCSPQRFTLKDSEAELFVLPTSLNLKIERNAAWEQSKALFMQLLESGVPVRSLRVEFAGEQAADGGGPAREWFTTVASGWEDVRKVVGSQGWFVPGEEKEAENTAAFLGLLLAFAALHTAKIALAFALPPVAFKIATAFSLDDVALTPVDLEFADPALAKSLQSVLDWTPASTEADVEKAFDSTFSLTWSTTIRTGDGEIKTIDLVPGGRHRSVKVGERVEFVSKLVWRVLIGSVRKQVLAFRDAWQTIMPSTWLANTEEKRGADSATEILSRGGLALSLFSAEEISQAILSLPSSTRSSSSNPLDVADIRDSTDVIFPSSNTVYNRGVLEWFWHLWSTLSPLLQRRLLAFITGAEDLPATGAQGIGLRIHLVPTDVADLRAWPLPWSSTCTSTLFLPTYPSEALLEEKVRIAIEHYQGFGLR